MPVGSSSNERGRERLGSCKERELQSGVVFRAREIRLTNSVFLRMGLNGEAVCVARVIRLSVFMERFCLCRCEAFHGRPLCSH